MGSCLSRADRAANTAAALHGAASSTFQRTKQADSFSCSPDFGQAQKHEADKSSTPSGKSTPRESTESSAYDASKKSTSTDTARTSSLIGEKLPTVPERPSQERGSAEEARSSRPPRPDKPDEEQMLTAIMDNARWRFETEQAKAEYVNYLTKGNPGDTPYVSAYAQRHRRKKGPSSLASIPSSSLSDVGSNDQGGS